MSKHPRLQTQAVHLAALGIGASDVIFRFQQTPGNPMAALNELAYDYSAGLLQGQFDYQAALRAYGPLLAAYGFNKGMGFLLKRFRI